MNFTRYGSYKQSGADWLGSIPQHWSAARVKTLFEVRKRIAGELGHDVLSVTQQGLKVRDTESNDGQLSMDYSKYQLVEPDDFVMNHMDLLTGYVDLSRFHGVTSPDYRVFTARTKNLSQKFFLYLFQNGYQQRIFYAFGQGASELGRWRMPTDSFNDFVLPVPPPYEQIAIASFLDRETAKIDGLVEEQQRLIKLLKQKRQAIISRAVTKGLDPNAPMKDSGVEWLGEVPEHWSVLAFRYLISRIEQGWSPECESRQATLDEWGVLKTGCGNGAIFREEENKALPGWLNPLPELEVRRGDVLMSRANGSPENVGATAYVTSVRPRLMLSDKIFRLHPSEKVRPQFLALLLGSLPLRHQIERSISGAGGLANNLPQSALKEFIGLVPPLGEQDMIVAHVEADSARVAALLTDTEATISLLQERRTALISAAVSGKIDVCGKVEADTPIPEVVAA